jgi:hypothetical protein
LFLFYRQSDNRDSKATVPPMAVKTVRWTVFRESVDVSFHLQHAAKNVAGVLCNIKHTVGAP